MLLSMEVCSTKLRHPLGLELEHFFRQVVHDVVMAAGKRRDKAVDILTALHRKRQLIVSQRSILLFSSPWLRYRPQTVSIPSPRLESRRFHPA